MVSLQRPRYLPPGLHPREFAPVYDTFWGDLFTRLWRRWGDPYWWPGSDPWEVAVGAVLTQNTSWSNVEKALAELRTHGWTSPEAILNQPLEELAPVIRSAGYYNQKAKKLHLLAELWLSPSFKERVKVITQTNHPDNASVQQLREVLLGVWGIGPETADSIGCYALGLPVFVVDAYTQRMVARMRNLPGNSIYEVLQAEVETSLPRDTMLFNHLHGLIVVLGKEHCRARVTLCKTCPLVDMCHHGSAVTRDYIA